jgi:hypothetical protein
MRMMHCRLRLGSLHLFDRFGRLLVRRRRDSVHFEEDVSDLASLVLAVVQLLDDAFLGRCDFRELFVGLDVGHLLKLADAVALLHVQFLDATFLDLFAEVGEGEAEESEGSGEASEKSELPQGQGSNHSIIIKLIIDHRSS